MKDGVRLARQRGDNHVRLAVVIVVLKHYPHSRQGPAVQVERRTGLQTNLGKCAIAVVVKQILLHAVVRYINVGKSVSIVVRKRHSETVAFLRRDPRSLAYIFNRSVSAVVVENVGGAGKFSRRTIGVKVAATIFAVLSVPLHVTGNKQIELAVVVIVEKSR